MSCLRRYVATACIVTLSATIVGCHVFAPEQVAAPTRATQFSYPLVLDVSEGSLIVDAGELFVPANRTNAQSQQIAIPYFRLPGTAATHGKQATFILAGGPGEPLLEQLATDAVLRSIVTSLRTVDDVVLFDQRGAGQSRPRLDCTQRMTFPSHAMTREDFVSQLKTLSAACKQMWLDQHVDLSAFHTLENAADLEALRLALGYERINLLAHSYGTHLALAFVRTYPTSVARVVLHGVEGPDHTYDLPSEVLGVLTRIASDAERSKELAAFIPRGGLLAALREVLRRLDAHPVHASTGVADASGITIGRFDVERIARRGVVDRPLTWPALIIEMYHGNFTRAAALIAENRRWPIDSAMYSMMDCASGLSAPRAVRLRDAAERAAMEMIGDINLVYGSTCDIWRSPDLGERFRSTVISDAPLLVFQGTWDVSTPMINAEDVLTGFRNGVLLRVERGSHFGLWDLIDTQPKVLPLLTQFIAGEPGEIPKALELPMPEFVLPDIER